MPQERCTESTESTESIGRASFPSEAWPAWQMFSCRDEETSICLHSMSDILTFKIDR